MYEVKNIITTDQKLLFNMCEQLMEQNKLIKQLLEKEDLNTDVLIDKEEKNADKADIDVMKRKELMQFIKGLKNKPNDYATWKTEKMRKFVKECDKCNM